MKKYNNKMEIESLGLPMFDDIETLAEETRLTEKLVFFLTEEEAREIVRKRMERVKKEMKRLYNE